jgi:hypothetical protein
VGDATVPYLILGGTVANFRDFLVGVVAVGLLILEEHDGSTRAPRSSVLSCSAILTGISKVR